MATDLKTLTPDAVQADTASDEVESSVAVASQWQLMWWKFRKHKLAILGAVVYHSYLSRGPFCRIFGPVSYQRN